MIEAIDQKLETVGKLRKLKEEFKDCIRSQKFLSPLFTFYKQFSFDTLKYENYRKHRMMINLTTIFGITRLLEIVQIVLMLAEKGEYITKRNLYYKLVHYYKIYTLIDTDIQLLALNVGLLREDLRIVSSSRCLLLGELTLYIDSNELKCTSKMITNITSYRKLKDSKTQCKNLFIIEKQSAMHQIHQQLIQYFLKHQECSWFKESIFISAKGYPDNTCRGIVQRLCQKIENIYYLGDEDIYGVDILLCYAIGFNRFSTILNKTKWVDLVKMNDPKSLELQYQILDKQDKKKYLEIMNRNYMKDLDDFLPKNKEQLEFKLTLLAWKQRLMDMKQCNRKIELQSLFKFLPPDWVQRVLSN